MPDKNGLNSAITEILLTAVLQIQVFTGMRSSEVNALPYFCLDTEIRNGVAHFIIKGRTTKLNHGRIKRTQWVTSQSGARAVKIAQRIAGANYQSRGLAPEENSARINDFPLFVSAQKMKSAATIGIAYLRLHGSRLKERLQI